MKEIQPPRKENTRDEILRAAYDLFLENGFHGASMRSIARRAGIALGGIYNHFSSKEEIFTTIILEQHPYRKIVAQMNLSEGATLEAQLHDAARRLNETILENPDGFLKLIFIELVEFNARHVPQLFQEMYPHLAMLETQFFSERAEMRDIPPLVMLRAFLGLFFSYFMTEWLFAEHLPPESRQNALDHFVDIYLHGVMKPE